MIMRLSSVGLWLRQEIFTKNKLLLSIVLCSYNNKLNKHFISNATLFLVDH